jgi:hypothetical protein
MNFSKNIKMGIMGIIILAGSLSAGSIIKEFRFSQSDFEFTKIDNYDYVKFKDGINLHEIGKPSLPYKDVYFLIPPGSEITKINIISKKEEVLPGEYYIYPSQRYFPLSHPEIFKFTPPDEKTYSSSNPYPESHYKIFPSGSKSGFRIQGIRIYPLRYIPKDKKLILLKEIKIEVIYEEGKHEIISLTKTQLENFSSDIKNYVINPEDIQRFSPPVKYLRQQEINYAIITSDQFVSSFENLKNWRTKQGWKAGIFTTSWIYNNYTGYDNQEKIRNFIKDYFQNHGLIYVLIGGDANVVPVRKAYLPVYGDAYIATDLYYADLNGTWDADGDHLYGEIGSDGVDVYADVYVGRLPARTTTHIQHFLDKIFTYEKNPPTGYQKRVELPSVMLFSQYNWHGREVNNRIGDSLNAGSSGWILRKLEDPSSTATRDSFSHGFNFCHGAAHGDEYGWYYQSGSVVFVSSQISGLTNGTKYTIVNAIACYSGDFDEITCCFAESLLTKYPSGAVATMMNTRYGWGDPPGFGPSELLDIKFYAHFAKRDEFIIGKAHFKAKDSYRNNIISDTIWAYCGYELTLLGDPAMPMWENSPITMTVEHPAQIPLTTYDVEVTVKTANNLPVQNALVCLYKPNEVHVKGYTNSQGKVTLTVSPQTLGDMYITVTAKDYLPYEGIIQVVASGMPNLPTIVSPLDFARLPGLNPTLKFYSTDPQNEGIEYRVKWSLYPDFSISDSLTTSVYPSGQVVSVTLPNLQLNKTYWWKVKCRDPQGSGYWTPYTQKRSFTVSGGSLPENTCSWFQETGAQFSYNTFNGTKVEGDSVVLIPTGGTVVCTLLFENFEQGIVPPGWTVIDGNNDGFKWTVGTTSDLGGYTPPNYGTKYAYYSDDDAGNGVINYNEELWTPKVAIPQSASNLTLKYGYGFQVYQPGEKFRVHFRKKVGSSWTNWQELRVYTDDISGTDSIDLTNQLPCDSIQFRFFYSDSTSSSHWGWACASDNVLIKYSYELQNNFGTMLTVPVLYSELNNTFPRTSWGDIIVYKGTEDDSICIQVEYFDGSNWNLVPESLLPGNSTGIYGDTISINNLPPDTYHTLRVKCLFYRKIGETPQNPTLRSLEVGNLARISKKEKGVISLIPFINVSRNVFKGNLIISYSIPERIDKISLRIYDVNGRCVKDLSKKLIKGKESQIVINNLKKGVYFIKFKAGEYRKDLKVIKIK